MDKKTPHLQTNQMKQLSPGPQDAKSPILVFISGFVLGLVVFWLFGALSGTTESTENVENADGTMETTEVEGETEMTGGAGEMMEGEMSMETVGNAPLMIADQLAGESVSFERIEIAVSGWAVVHEESTAGVIGNALGARRLGEPGVHEAGTIPLQRNTEPGRTYHVFLYQDNGDGSFNLKSDTLLNEAGRAVSVSFKTIDLDRKN